MAGSTDKKWGQSEGFRDRDIPLRDDLMRGTFDVSGGTMPLPTGPGLGIDLDLDVVRAHPYDPRDMNQYREDRRLKARRTSP